MTEPAFSPGEPGRIAFDAVSEHKIVAIIRGLSVSQAVAAALALAAGGIRALEVTFGGVTVPQIESTASAIAEIGSILPPAVAVGAGTVLTTGQLAAAREAGARFIVSPDTNPEVIQATRRAGLASFPGAASATECVDAWRAGATMVKLFPAGSLGLDYFRALRGPLPWLPLMAVGGIDLTNAADFLSAGASGLGVGGRLVDKAWIAAGDLDRVTDIASQFTRIAKEGSTP